MCRTATLEFAAGRPEKAILILLGPIMIAQLGNIVVLTCQVLAGNHPSRARSIAVNPRWWLFFVRAQRENTERMSSLPQSQRRRRSMTSRWIRILRAIGPFGRRHRRPFVLGALAALFVVAIRLVLPWPLRALMEPWLGESAGRATGLLALFPTSVNPALAMGGLFLFLVLSLGFVDYLARLNFARFAIGTIRDLRAEAFRRAVHVESQSRAMGSGDLVARLIGDTARIKAGLKGFLIHVVTNGVMFAGVTGVLLWIDFAIGMIFVAAGVLVAISTSWGACAMFHRALKYRNKEGQLADHIHETWQDEGAMSAFGEVNDSSGRHEAALTSVQGAATWAAHIILGVAVVAALWVGTNAVAAGRVAAGDLLVVMMYALMIRAPIVQLARQGTRTGKILACGHRLERLLGNGSDVDQVAVRPLRQELRLEGARLATRRAGKRIRRLGPIDLRIPAGQHVAIIGKAGSGKTTLLELIAGMHSLRDGRLVWDGQDVSRAGAEALSEEVAFLPHSPTWSRRRVSEMLETRNDTLDEVTLKLLRWCGAKSLLKRLPEGMATKLGSAELSPRERSALALACVVRGEQSLWLLDDPVNIRKKSKARKLIKRILMTKPEVTKVVTLSRPIKLKKFDRVIVMKRGRVAFDGTPQQWRAGLAERQRASATPKAEEASIGRGERLA